MMRERQAVEEDIQRHASPMGGLNPIRGGEISLELLLDIRELLNGIDTRLAEAADKPRKRPTPKKRSKPRSRR